MAIRIENDEMVSKRDFARNYTAHMSRLLAGDVAKLVLIEGTEVQGVVLPLRTYEKLAPTK